MTWQEYSEKAFATASPIYSITRMGSGVSVSFFPAPMLTAVAGLVSEIAELEIEHAQDLFSPHLCRDEAGDCLWYAMLLLRLIDDRDVNGTLVQNFTGLLENAERRVLKVANAGEEPSGYIRHARICAAKLCSLLKKTAERQDTFMLEARAVPVLDCIMDVIASIKIYLSGLPRANGSENVVSSVLQANLEKLRARHGTHFNGNSITMR